MSQPPAPPFRIRDLGLSVYLPTFLFAVGQGASIPFTPLIATDMGASVAFAAFTVGVRGVGMMVFDVPAGMLVGAVGERWAMVVATVLLVVVSAGAAVTQSPAQFAVLMFVMGWSWSIWQLARLTYVSDHAPPEVRGRALSLVGGTNRIGNFVGPFIGGLLAVQFGLVSTFHLQAVCAIVACALMFLLMRSNEGTEGAHGSMGHRFTSVITENRRIFATAGLAIICLGVLRASRQTVIPLWGEHIGLDAQAVGYVFGLSGGLDMLLFYPTGVVMDRWGRKWVAIPCLTVLALGMILIPWATTLIPFIVVALITGLGNGMGSGIVMTLGADFSPPQNRAEFLGVWRLIGDIGQSAGPFVLSAVTGIATLGIASIATGGIGLVGAAITVFFVAETLPKRARAPQIPEAPR